MRPLRYEWEWRKPGEDGWRRSKFELRPDVVGIHEAPDDEAMAREMLEIMSRRYHPGWQFRLIRVVEEQAGEVIVCPEWHRDCG